MFTWAVCGGWDWFLYCSPLSSRLARYKITPRYPAPAQFSHDAAFTSLARYPGHSESCSFFCVTALWRGCCGVPALPFLGHGQAGFRVRLVEQPRHQLSPGGHSGNTIMEGL